VAKSSAKSSPKSVRERDRRAVVEQLRREQQARERRRTSAIVVGCVVVGLVIIGVAAVPLLRSRQEAAKPLDEIGASASAAGCGEVTTKNAEGSGQHVAPGTDLSYPDSPPAFGQHWENYLQGSQLRPFFTADDRPELGQIVHSLEHGHTLVWYDETLADDDEAMSDLRTISKKFDAADKVMVLPWKADDGDPFPGGKHVALTHWSVSGGKDDTAQVGVWQYCARPSGAEVQRFVDDYPAGDAPEPNAP
jgi:hypothetical protein